MEAMPDKDPLETTDWLDALRAVQQHRGAERANYLLTRLVEGARRMGDYVPPALTTAYCNTIPADREAKSPGDRAVEHRIRSAIRWNAVAIILRANKESSELGGHIASFQSSALLYDIGWGHFWHAPTEQHGGDLIYCRATFHPASTLGPSLKGVLAKHSC